MHSNNKFPFTIHILFIILANVSIYSPPTNMLQFFFFFFFLYVKQYLYIYPQRKSSYRISLSFSVSFSISPSLSLSLSLSRDAFNSLYCHQKILFLVIFFRNIPVFFDSFFFIKYEMQHTQHSLSANYLKSFQYYFVYKDQRPFVKFLFFSCFFFVFSPVFFI